MIGIVVPFFQRTPGLLNRALLSVAAQEGAPPFHIYVVDDSSPVSAESELAGLGEDLTHNVTILRQPNGGPGAARNLALDRVSADTTFIAFLDSDDAWTSNHLHNVATAFAAGADFYFAEHQREEDAQSRFVQCAFRPDGGPVAGGDDTIFYSDARTLSRAIMMRSPIGTSTVAIRRDKIGQTRFATWLRSAGEDSIFWLEILRTNIKIACGVTLEGALGRGVSVFNHRGWGDVATLRTVLDEMHTHIYLRENFALDRTLAAQNRTQCRALDETFCLNLLGCIRRGNWPPPGLVVAYFRQRPLAPLRLPATTAHAIGHKLAILISALTNW